jgi:sortase A
LRRRARSKSGSNGQVLAAAPTTGEKTEPLTRRRNTRRRRIAKVLIAAGVVLVAYSATVVLWRDPATDLYARWRQHELAGELEDAFAAYAASLTPPQELPATQQEMVEVQRERVEAAANRANDRLRLGKPLGRIVVPDLDLNAIFVQGTRWGPDLSQGPGHYAETSLPGVGRTVAIAAHRTTFGAWFRHIDDLRAGDSIALRVPYATFTYHVFGHKIVDNDDWSIIRDRGFDTLVLSACHPLYSASYRWIVFAALTRVDPVRGTAYLVDRQNRVRPVSSSDLTLAG